MQEKPADASGIALRRALPVVWLAAIVAALGAEVTGLAIGQLGSDDRAWGIAHLGIALGIWLITNAVALALLYYGLFRLSPLPQYSARTSVRTLLLGGLGVAALSNAITPGGARPAFGSLTMLLLTVPYLLAYLLIEARRRRPVIATVAIALALSAAAVPLRDAQQHHLVRNWLGRHPATDRALLATVDWPGAFPDPGLTTGSFGTRVTVRYPGDDSDEGGTITLSAATADPCVAMAQLATDDGVPPTAPIGSLIAVRPERCAPTSASAWSLSDGDWSGYAVHRDGLLVTLTFFSPGRHPDLPAIARSLHPLSDADLWPYLQAGSGVPFLLR